MSFQNRKAKILNIVNLSNEEVTVSQIAEFLNVSEITIRRDLKALDLTGDLKRTHGGVMSNKIILNTVTYKKKEERNSFEKEFIAQLAAKEIIENDTIFMDCGSTVFKLCEFIKNKKIKVITNSLPVVLALKDTEVSINLIGGELNSKREAVHGIMAIEHIKKYKVNKAFVGIDGISINGLYANSELEASITLAMIEQAQTSYLLCDSSKINQEKYYHFAALNVIDYLITNAKSEVLKNYKKAGIKLINS